MKNLFFLICLVFSFSLAAQNDCIRGKVVDESGNELIGVSVLVAGTKRGTVTDIDGAFSLCEFSPEELVELVFSYTGYAVKTTKLSVGETRKTIVLSPDANVLEEVVVIGYGIQRKSQMAGSVSAIASEDMARSRKMRGRRQRKHSSRPIGGTAPENTEQYNTITENGFKQTKEEAFSTISTDVDRAAYANVRRFLNQGQLPPVDAVRTEEMINYFTYNDPDPQAKDEIALRTEFMTCPWNPQNQLLRVSARTMPIATADVPASNLVFLLDVSGSMSNADKLPLVKESLKLLTRNLRQEDRVAIVVYAGAAGLVLPSTSNPADILSALDKLNAGGSTAGGAGIELAYKTAANNFIEGGNNRVILATDGDFNVGVSNQDALVKLIEEKRESGIYLTVLGFGTGNYQEGTMQLLADKGNGNHGYIDSPAEAKKMLVTEFGGTLYTVAKDVKLQLEFDPKVIASYRLIGYENRLLNKEDFDDDTKDAAEMGAGHNVTVLYELSPANGYSQANFMGYLRLRYKPNTGGRSRKISVPVAAKHVEEEYTSNDLRWAAVVAEFAMLLRDSEHKGEADWGHCLTLAKNALGKDTEGYRAEMTGLIEKAQKISEKTKR